VKSALLVSRRTGMAAFPAGRVLFEGPLLNGAAANRRQPLNSLLPSFRDGP
jgi:hypothetical protein